MKFTDDGWKAEGRIMTPGSTPAIEAGCKCTDKRNCHGLGAPKGDGYVEFYPSAECPIHENWPGVTKPLGH